MSFTDTYCTVCGSYHAGTACRTANVIRIGKGDTVPSLPENDLSRRIAVQHAADSLIDATPHRCDSDFLHAMQGWLGEAADAYLHGHSNIADHAQRMYAACARFLEDELARQAR